MGLVLISTYIDNHNIKNNASGNLDLQVPIGSVSIVSIMWDCKFWYELRYTTDGEGSSHSLLEFWNVASGIN